MDDNYDLDTSWIEKYQHPELFREPMDKVRVYLLYIHANMSIDKIVQEDVPLELLGSKPGHGVSSHGVSSHGVSSHGVSSHGVSSHGVSSHGVSSHGVSSHGVSGHGVSGHGVSSHGVSSHGVSKEVLLKIIHDGKTAIPHKKYKLKDILVFNVDLEPSNIQSFSEEVQFMKKIPIVDDIILAPSLYIFHYLNGIFIFLQEYGSIDPKSILKTRLGSGGSKPHTKKVRLNDQVEYEDDVKHHNKTKRRRQSSYSVEK